jgi:precorrin-3B C17-methyltransferase
MLRHRAPSTPVAIVKSAYREREHVQHVTLDQMAECDIGMLTTVLIGNSTTFHRAGIMVTPRGYANKYDTLTGAARDGESAGRSLTMGLTGWKGCVRRYLHDRPSATLDDAVRDFDMPLGDILDAVAMDDLQNPAGSHRAAAVTTAHLDALPATLCRWGRLRLQISTTGTPAAELALTGDALCRDDHHLTALTPAFRLSIRWSDVRRAWFACRSPAEYGVQFVDDFGRRMFAVLLSDLDARAVRAYIDAWELLCRAPIEETHTHA